MKTNLNNINALVIFVVIISFNIYEGTIIYLSV